MDKYQTIFISKHAIDKCLAGERSLFMWCVLLNGVCHLPLAVKLNIAFDTPLNHVTIFIASIFLSSPCFSTGLWNFLCLSTRILRNIIQMGDYDIIRKTHCNIYNYRLVLLESYQSKNVFSIVKLLFSITIQCMNCYSIGHLKTFDSMYKNS